VLAVAALVGFQTVASIGGMTAGDALDPYRHMRGHNPAIYDTIEQEVIARYPGAPMIVFVPTGVATISAYSVATPSGREPLLGRPIRAFERACFANWRNRFPLDSNRVIWAIDWDALPRDAERERWIAGPRLDGGEPLLGRWPRKAELDARFPERAAIRAEIDMLGNVRLTELWPP
jgi:hypothetical protein